MEQRTYRIKGYTKGAVPMAKADFYYPKGPMKGWHEVKNLGTKIRLARKFKRR
jgi:hypothetical protein